MGQERLAKSVHCGVCGGIVNPVKLTSVKANGTTDGGAMREKSQLGLGKQECGGLL